VRVLVPLVLDGEDVEPGRVTDRQRLQQQPVDDREDCRVGPDAQAKCQDDSDGE
jgi:hypothetical protein